MLKALINEWISVSLAKISFKNLQKYWVWRDCQVKDREGRKGRKGPMGERGRGRAWWWWRCLCLAIQVVSDRSHRLAFPSPCRLTNSVSAPCVYAEPGLGVELMAKLSRARGATALWSQGAPHQSLHPTFPPGGDWLHSWPACLLLFCLSRQRACRK